MNCMTCHEAEPVIQHRGAVDYWHKDHMTTIQGVDQYVCPRCGTKSIPPGQVQRWLEQTAAFRAAIDAQEPDGESRRVSWLQKDTILIEWLDLDPDKLAAEVPVTMIERPWRDAAGNLDTKELPYLSWRDVAAYDARVYQAFAGYKGSHSTDLSGHSFAHDWEEFLDSLRRARAIASDPWWEAPRDGEIFHNPF